MIKTRKCSTCKETKPITEFYGDEYRCKNCAKILLRKLRKEHPERFNTEKRKLYNKNYQRERRKSRRTKIIERLGGKCIKCEFNDIRALQIDHIYGNGKQETKTFTNHDQWYKYLLNLSDEELLKNYQCLCANCNWIKRTINNELYLKK